MFLHLIKYDLKFILKTVLIYGIVLLTSALLMNLTSYDYTPTILDASGQVFGGDPDAPVIIQFLHTVFYNAVIAMLIAMFLNAIIRTWARFKISMYGDEAYLTHTLPIPRHTLWLSKFLSSALALIITFIIAGLTALILNLTPSGKQLIGAFGLSQNATPLYYFTYFITVFAQFFFMTMCGLSGIVIGYRHENHRTLHTLLWGFLIYIIGALLLFALIYLLSLIDLGIHQAIFGDSLNSHGLFTLDFIIKILSCIGLAYLTMSIILFFLDRKLLQKGINLD